jgi:hypothetical protein
MDIADYRPEHWAALVLAAKAVQDSDPNSVERALAAWQENRAEGLPHTTQVETKVYLLMRVVFDLPERAPARDRYGFGGWLHDMPTEEPPVNPDGTVNLAWPVSWRSGDPRLVAGFQGLEGQPYDAVAEYRYLNARYKPRDLSSFKYPSASKKSAGHP